MAVERPKVGEEITKQIIEEEAESIESTLTMILDRHATQIRITVRFKRWWTQEVEAKRKEYG